MILRNTILAAMLALPATAARASTVLTFDVVSHSEAAQGVKDAKGVAPPADASYTQTVTLAGDTLLIDEPDKQARYDFKGTRIDALDKRTRSYDERSLYTVIGFNVAEFSNRMMLGGMLAAGKVKNNPMAPALTENLMSMSDPANATVIEHRATGAEVVYSWNGQTLMRVSPQTREVPAGVLTQYLRFLRYSTGGHPQILAALGGGRGIPERLTVVRTNMGVETRTLTLRSIEERPDAPFALEGYTRATPEGEPYATLKRLSATPAADVEARAAVLWQERDAALTAGHVLDALLANFAAALAIGDQSAVSAWIAAHREAISADADVQAMIGSMNPKDAAGARLGADTLAGLKRSAGPHAYVLNIFEANIRLGLHEGNKAIELFLAALAAEPTITGVWVDLGGAYYGGFRADAAWACWDTARALRPTHYMLKAVDERERKLRADHPEFF